MIKRTKSKFIAIAMLSVTLVLAVLMTVLNIMNYARVDQEAEALLSFLAENGGRFPEETMSSPRSEPNDEMGSSGEMTATEEAASGEMAVTGEIRPSGEMGGEASAAAGEALKEDIASLGGKFAEDERFTSDDFVQAVADVLEERTETVMVTPVPVTSAPASGEMGAARGGERKEQRRGFTQETPYETRYFSVTLSGDGTVLESDTTQIAAVTAEQAGVMAQGLYAAGQTSGYYVNYKYLMQPLEEGVQYVFLDCTTDRTAAEDFLRISVLVSLCGMAVFYLLVLILSGWVIKPMAASYDKQKEFITNAGHELKTPLAVIGSCTDVLELEQGENKWITGIRNQVARLGVLTQELVALARMDEGKTLDKEEFDLSVAVLEELEQFRVSAEQQGLTMSLDIQPCIIYRGNQASLRQLAAILGDNAVKYTVPEGEISFRLTKKGRKIYLTGTNPAEGLEAGDQSRLLERFYRGDVSHSSETSGYGIGLSLAASIAAAHGGKIEARSEDGKSFTIAVQL